MKLPDHWFYGSADRDNARFTFSPEETNHATKVLRLREGDGIQWVDGSGGRYAGQIIGLKRSGMVTQVLERAQEERPATTRLSVGLLHDSSRLEWLVEKAVELGATRIDLVLTDRVQPSRYKIGRLEAKAVAAMKQSGGAYLPLIAEVSFADLIRELTAGPSPKQTNPLLAPEELRVIAHCYTEPRRMAFGPLAAPAPLGSGLHTVPHLHLLIGPEGDFTVQEVEAAERVGFAGVSLGARRLRSETAAVAALAAWGLR